MSDIANPTRPPYWPYPEYVTPDMEGPAPWSVMPCGCYLRRPDYEAVLCPEHLAELNDPAPAEVAARDRGEV